METDPDSDIFNSKLSYIIFKKSDILIKMIVFFLLICIKSPAHLNNCRQITPYFLMEQF